MVKRITVILILTFLIGLLVSNLFVYAQGGGEVPLPQKIYPGSFLQNFDSSRSLSAVNRLNATDFPYNSYNSGELFFPPYRSVSDRIGFGKTSSHDTSSFNAGWYIDWGANVTPQHPGGVEYARTIYFQVNTPRDNCAPPPDGAPDPATELSQVTANYTGTALINNVLVNPGALWLIGNEFDTRYNGSPIQAELYAELYHYFYTTIKATDPTAMVAIGGVSQPSPLRMKYLEKILNHYQTAYGEKFPTDVWNIHFYYMNEWYERTDGGHEECEWGAGIPPFTSAEDMSLAWGITVEEFDQGVPLDLQKLETNLRNFRQWMSDQGYQDTPLIITEHGMLASPMFGGPYTNENAAQFLHDIFYLFQTATDVNTGYPTDNYRLVQMWNWFSTHADDFGGNLFDEYGNVSIIGQAFSSEINGNFTPYADMQLIMDGYTQTNTSIDVDAYAQNRGNSAASNVQTSVTLVDATSGQVVGEKTINWGMVNRRYQDEPISLAHTWQLTSAQTITVPYNLVVSVSGSSDVDITNNTYTTQVDWSPVVNMVISETTFSTGNPFKFTEPVTATITATIINRGNFTATATTADIIANGSEVLLNDVQIPVLLPMAQYQITTTKYISSMLPLKILVKINSLEDYELEPDNTRMETTLLYERIYLPLIMR